MQLLAIRYKFKYAVVSRQVWVNAKMFATVYETRAIMDR